VRSRTLPVVVAMLLLGASGCKWDLGQTLFHPTVDHRVKESFSLAPPAPVAVNPDSFRFAVFGDIHVREDTLSRLSRFRADVGPKGIDFFCLLGDIAHDGLADEYARAESMLTAVGIPYYVTVGNHDLYQADGWQSFRTRFGPSCYSVTIADRLKLIFLDTGDGNIGEPQFDWLEGELADTSHVKLVGTHFPVYDGSTPIMWRIAGSAERARLVALLRDHHAYGYAAGHIHGWRRQEVAGLSFFTTGTMPPTDEELDYGKAGYVLFTFAHDSLSWQRIDF
jgi:predicted phosphodiesterase